MIYNNLKIDNQNQRKFYLVEYNYFKVLYNYYVFLISNKLYSIIM